ncbi:MAG: carbohydrate binding domain-containing protein [Planctomycetota bacterium]
MIPQKIALQSEPRVPTSGHPVSRGRDANPACREPARPLGPLLSSSGPRTATRYRRRGNSYIFFLGMSMLVAIIGLSALTGVRIKRQATLRLNERAAAQVYAQSAIEFSLLQIYLDTSWRDSFLHDQWSAAQPFGAGSFSWKLLDDINGDFTTDRNASVRMFGKGYSGQSVWVYSALVQPPLESSPTNLLVNGDMEAGTANWSALNCNLVSSAGAHGGATCLLLDNRSSFDSEGYQLVTGSVRNGATYDVEVWAKKETAGSDLVTISIKLTTDKGWTLVVTPSTSVGTSWTKVAGTLQTSWTGNLVEARWRTFTYPDGNSSDFYIDDARMLEKKASGGVGLIPGTWKREPQ